MKVTTPWPLTMVWVPGWLTVAIGCSVTLSSRTYSPVVPFGSTRIRNDTGGADARLGDIEIDLHQNRGAANAHRGGRRLDFHVAVFRGRAGDERDGPLHQRQQRGVVRPGRVVDHLVQHHPRIRRETEHGAVDEGDAERGIGPGLDDVALVDVVADVQGDRNAVANRGRAAGELGDLADDLFRRDIAAGLRVVDLAGERPDGLAGEVCAIRGGQRGSVLAAEIVARHEFVAVLRQHQVEAGPLVVAGKQQMGVRNDNSVRPAVPEGAAPWMNIDGKGFARSGERTLAAESIQN